MLNIRTLTSFLSNSWFLFFNCLSSDKIFSRSCVTATTLSLTDIISLLASIDIDVVVDVTGAIFELTDNDVLELFDDDIDTVVAGAGKNVPLLVLINDLT